jgi:hypothetical protein
MMYNNFKYFRKLLTRKEPLDNINKNYLRQFAENEIKEWKQFLKDIK